MDFPRDYAPIDRTAFREYAGEACRIPETSDAHLIGEWVGQERNAQRGRTNDPLIALAEFIYGTITEGCGCEECDARRETVMTLISDPNIDTEEIGRAIG